MVLLNKRARERRRMGGESEVWMKKLLRNAQKASEKKFNSKKHWRNCNKKKEKNARIEFSSYECVCAFALL